MAIITKPQIGTAPFTQPVQKPTFGDIGSGLSKIGGALGSLMPKPTSMPGSTPAPAGSLPFSNIPKAGNPNYAPLGVQAKAPEQSVTPPASTIAASQIKTQPIQATGTTSKQAGPLPQGGTTPNGTVVGSNGSTTTPPPSLGGTTPNGTVIGANGAAPTQSSTTNNQTNNQTTQGGQQSPYSANPGLYAQLIAAMANRSTQPSDAFNSAMGSYNNAADQIKQSQLNEANAEAQNRLNPIPIGDQTGREAVMRNQYLAQQSALGNRLQASSNVLGAANTQQNLQQQILQQAAAGAAPTSMSPGNYLQSPLGGGAADSASGQAAGFTSRTNNDISQMNSQIAQGAQKTSTDLGAAQQLIQSYGNKVSQLMSDAKLNPSLLPDLNAQINTINAKTNPVAWNTVNEAINGVISQTQTILQSGNSMTPTDAGQLTSNWAANMRNLNPQQLADFIGNIEQLSNIRRSIQNAIMDGAYSAAKTPGAVFSGPDIQKVQDLQTGATSVINNLPDWAKGGAGAVLNYGGAIAQVGAAAAEGYKMGGATGAAVGAVLPDVAKQFFK